jgi:hypothetical protein
MVCEQLLECSVQRPGDRFLPHAWPRQGLTVAHLADQHHIGVLPHKAAKRIFKLATSMPTSRWGNNRLLIHMQKLNRVFNGHDMTATFRLT